MEEENLQLFGPGFDKQFFDEVKAEITSNVHPFWETSGCGRNALIDVYKVLTDEEIKKLTIERIKRKIIMDATLIIDKHVDARSNNVSDDLGPASII